MALSEDRLRGLADRLARAMDGGTQKKSRAHLQVVPSAPAAAGGLDQVTRTSHYRMIRHIRRRWGYPMQMLIDQATFGLPGVEDLSDDALVALHRDLERAQDCMREGISFEDAGLIRPRYE